MMAKDGQAKQVSLTQEVADRIRDAIVQAEFELGEAIPEDSLAEAMGISRTPVREAMRILQMEGLVEVVPKSGTYVFNPTQEELLELCEFRIALELKASGLAMRRAAPETLTSLNAALETMRQALQGNDMRMYSLADMAFHNAFFEHCGNRYLRHAYVTSLARVSALRTHLAVTGEGEPDRSFFDHARIAQLFEQRDEGGLPEILEEHILRTRTHYLRALAKRARDARQNGGRAGRMRRKLGIAG